jgi:uncharacterized protein YebE (UPF0316 family)
MILLNIFNSGSDFFTWVGLPFLIFLARITDQSIGTIRLIFLSKGFRRLAPFIGFFESLIWLLAIREILNHLDNYMCFIAYAGGFATGNYIGMLLEEKISIGTVIVRVIPRRETSQLLNYLTENNYGFTVVDAQGSKGDVKIIFCIIKRKDLEHFISLIKTYNPNAFYSIEDVRTVNEGIFRKGNRRGQYNLKMDARKSK